MADGDAIPDVESVGWAACSRRCRLALARPIKRGRKTATIGMFEPAEGEGKFALAPVEHYRKEGPHLGRGCRCRIAQYKSARGGAGRIKGSRVRSLLLFK